MKRYRPKSIKFTDLTLPPKVRLRASTIDIVRALEDKLLLGAGLGDATSWSRWFSVLKAAFALKMSDSDLASFKEVSGNREPPTQRVKELWAIVGRRSGKTRVAAALAVYVASIEQYKLAAGEVGYVLLLAASRDQASVAFQYVLGFLKSSPLLHQQDKQYKEHLSGAWKTKPMKKQKEPDEREWEISGPLSDSQSAELKESAWRDSVEELQNAWRK